MGKPIGGDEMRQPTTVELAATVVLGAPLVLTLAKRHRFFKPVLVFSTVVFVGIACWVYSTSLRDYKAGFELAGDLFTQALVTGYLLVKVRTQDRQLAR
ncbi:MAG: hypothetical protein HY075_03515 [Deltaproteobacteria bacterium]|nr:hypothetical protein [Deltaproteobacteria bacterium]